MIVLMWVHVGVGVTERMVFNSIIITMFHFNVSSLRQAIQCWTYSSTFVYCVLGCIGG